MDDLEKIILELKQILKKYVDNEEINNETIIFNKKLRLIDSLEIMNFICDLESTFNINDLMYKDITLSNFENVITLARYIVELKRNEEMNKSIGYQVLIDIYNCNYDKMENLEYIKETMKELANILNTNIRQIAFEKFEPYGISGVLIIAESHITIHTWPEFNYAGIDIFTCNKKVEYDSAIKYLLEKLKSDKYEVKEIHRGKIF